MIRAIQTKPPAGTAHHEPDGDVHVWQLEASADGREWRTVNAGVLREGQLHVRGRFHPHETQYRVLWVPEGGGGFVLGDQGPLDGRRSKYR